MSAFYGAHSYFIEVSVYLHVAYDVKKLNPPENQRFSGDCI